MPKRFAIKMPGKLVIVLVWAIPLAIVIAGRMYLLQPKPTYELPPDIPVEREGIADSPDARSNAPLPTESPDLVRELDDLEKRFTHAASEGRPLMVIRLAVSDLVDEYPDSPGAHRLLGLVHLEDGRVDAAYQSLSKSLAIDPNQAEVSLTAGTVAVKLKRLDTARERYARALAINPQNNRFLLHMAQLDLHEGDIEAARTTANEMLARNDRSHRGHALLSSIAVEDGRTDEALEHLQTAIENTPLSEQDAQLKYQLQKVKLLRESQRLDDAIAVLRSLLFTYENKPEIIEEAALTWSQIGETAAAAELYEEALAERPEDIRLIVGAAKWNIAAGRFDAADRHILTLRQLYSHSPALQPLVKALAQARNQETGT